MQSCLHGWRSAGAERLACRIARVVSVVRTTDESWLTSSLARLEMRDVPSVVRLDFANQDKLPIKVPRRRNVFAFSCLLDLSLSYVKQTPSPISRPPSLV